MELCELLGLDTKVTVMLTLVFIIASVYRDKYRKNIVFLFAFRLHMEG